MIDFAVRDNGTGVPDDVMPHLFEAFYTTKAEGLGIGLNICRSIIEFHQGRLWAENQYNTQGLCGSVFRFTLPFEPLPVPSDVVVELADATAPHERTSP